MDGRNPYKGEMTGCQCGADGVAFEFEVKYLFSQFKVKYLGNRVKYNWGKVKVGLRASFGRLQAATK